MNMELPEQIQTFRDFLEVNEVYLRELHEQVRKGNAWFTVQFADLARHNPELAELLLEEPEDVLKAFQIAIDKMDLPRASEAAAPKIEPRIINLPPQQIIEIRNVRSKHLNRFVQLIGVVRQKSDVRPQMTSARFECPACGNIIPVLQIDQKFQEPSRCGCGRKGKFKLLTKELVDAQSITLEEAPEDLDGGEQPKRLKLFLKNDLVSPLSDKRTNPGSKITVVGVIKEVPIILQTGGQSTRFDLILEANALESIQEDFTEINISPEQEQDIRELSQDPDLFEKLVSSIAPNIYGHEPIKQALLLQMFGGVHKVRDKGIKSRGDIHMLLIGDPGSGKSVLLKRVSAIAPKARFVSGKGASGAGLTAAVVKDDFLKGWALEAGALVLANRGLCCTTEDAVFIKEDGSRMTFGKLFENETQDLIRPGFRVLGLDTKDMKVKPFAIKQAFRTLNTKKILRVKTRTGRTLDLTADNEVFTCADSITRWQAIGELKEGDFLAVPKNLPLKNGKKWDTNFAYICGLIASDGHIAHTARHSTVAFYNSEKYLIDRYRRALEALGWKSTTYTKAPGRTSTIRGKNVTTKKESHVILQTQKAFAQELMGFGIPVGNKSSVHPLDRRIFSYSRDAIAPFLRGVFDGDGSVRQNPAEITLCTGLEQNAKLFQSLFTRLGIVSSIKHSTNSWHCDVRGVKNCRTFLEMIGSSHPEKAARLLQITQLEKKDRIDVLPNHTSFFKSLLASRKGEIGAAHYKYLWHHSESGTAPSRERLEHINSDLDDPALRLFVESDVLWDKIVSLEEISADYVYDFTMIGTENFIANDIIMHNCIDELDKMTDEDTSAMHEALEQQCYDEETEVLTKDGWKRFKDTTMNDEFATLSPDGHLYYSKPSAIIKTEWKGGMYRIKSRRADLLVTPNHNMYAAVYKHGNSWHPYGLHKIADIADKRMKLKKDAVWLGTHQEWHTVPGVLKHKNQNASYTTGDITIRMDAWLEFLGWYLSEGSIRYMGDVPYSVMITQCKASGIKAIAHCLDKLPFTWKRHKDNFVINSKQLAMHLAVFGKAAQKHVPTYVKDLSREQINIFLEALMLGDGFSRTTAAGGPNRQYITSSSRLADDVQELLLKIGICGHKNPAAPKGTPIHIREKTVYSRNDCWSVQFVHSGIGHINTNGEKHITREKYQGMVYCAEVPDHTLYVRRNGVPVWCGNTISISKANIQATLRCETTVLAAANPKFGRFDPYEIISKQIELPPALLSRFDLIFPVRDLPDKAKDEKLASFILNRHKENLEVHEIITPERMRSYIAYARQTCHPRLTDAAILEIKEYYVKMRGGEDNPQTETALKPIPITARQLEALIRLAEASAKMRLSDRVTKRDAQVAIELVHYCLQQIGMDPETGKIDLDRVTSGIGASQRSHIQIVKELVKELEERVGKAIPIEEIVREAGIRGVADSTTEDVIEKLKRSGDVYSPKHGFISRT